MLKSQVAEILSKLTTMWYGYTSLYLLKNLCLTLGQVCLYLIKSKKSRECADHIILNNELIACILLNLSGAPAFYHLVS